MPVAFLTIPDKASDLLSAFSWRYMAHSALRGLRLGVLLFLIIYLIERRYGAPTSQYKSRNFLHDICYWFYSRSDLHRILFTASLFSFLGTHLAFVKIASFQSLPVPVRWLIYFVFADFFIYWIHRWQHSSPFLWAFHSVHHSQERLTFVTAVRTHPIDNFVVNTLAFIPLLLLGQPVKTWLPVYYVVEFLVALEHTEIPWRFGPLYRLVVSPIFHSIHHSILPEHHNRNFGRMLSVWDYLFGTAVREQTRPSGYGLHGLQMPTLASQLCFPFTHLFRDLLKSLRAGRPDQELSSSDPVQERATGVAPIQR
jgi:sterol desaturase/sphingolipid hydroxylase (fatty acid hydroxylase superfamily)